MICSSCGAPTPASPCVACTAEPRLQGRYSLLEVLGSGGSGVAFRAHDAETDDIVVVKELLLHQAEDLKALELFEREANTLKNLNHPGVPQFYASFQAGTGRNTGLYLVMEYIDGKTLKDLQHGLPFSETKALTYIESIAATLSYLHHLSPPVIHRDIKPSNIMVEHHSGRVVLIDFGAVQESIKAMGGTTVTGTYGYAPLEQWAGHARPASDVYALAATTLSLITAKAAHELVGTDGTIHWHQVETAASRLSASTRLILEQALHPNPDERPADATVFLQHLQARRAPTPSLSPSKQPPPPPKHLTEPALHLSRNTYSPRIQNPFSWSPILLFLMFTCGNLAFVAAGQGALDVANALLLAPTLGFGAEMILSASKRRKLRRQHQDFRKHAIRVKATLERLETPDVHFSFEDHQGTRHHHIVLLTWLPSGVTRPGDSFWLYVHRHDPTRFAIWLP